MLSKSFFARVAMGLLTVVATFGFQKGAYPSPPEESTTNPLSVDQLITKLYNHHSGDFFEQSSIEGQLNNIFGVGAFPEFRGFPEKNTVSDGRLLSVVVRDYFKQLQDNGPIIRTPDLANPFNTSLLENPEYLR
ncbi:MAG: hypothetical protein NZ901_10600 [Geminocystis sp.]|nr:hypothetical protein [Geminocystis sp.]MCS7148625.1 hypothetical protein [Geminocystis sp.]MCX8079399.1 hypothetical protein [Geminocystis sp.]MDW8114983.1 hypothetical protein [Geminocystis sp.]